MANQGVFREMMYSPIVSSCRFTVAYKASGGIDVCEISMIRLAASVSDPIVPEQCSDDKGSVGNHQGKAGDTKTLRPGSCRFKDEFVSLECHLQFPQRQRRSGPWGKQRASVTSYARSDLLGI